jgi:ribokinase
MKIYNLGSLNIDYVYAVDHFVAPGETMASEWMQVFPAVKVL